MVRRLCRTSYHDFLRIFWDVIIHDPFQDNWHIREMCGDIQTALEDVIARRPRKADKCYNVPPGTSKSTIVSVMLAPYLWTRMPHARVIGGSFARHIALTHSRLARDLVKSEYYRECFPEVRVRADMDQAGYFALEAGGWRYAVGAGGAVQGMHAHVITIDDPIDPKGALSEAEIFAVNHWINATLMGRKVDKLTTLTILVMQRLAQGDPTADMTDRGNVDWWTLPATDDYEVRPARLIPYYAANAGYLDPVRLPQAALDEALQVMGEYGYAGQFGQNPVPAGGGFFLTHLLRPEDPPPMSRLRRAVRFWDKAGTDERNKRARRASHTVGVLMGRDPAGRYFVMDVVRAQRDSFSRERLIKRTALRDGRGIEIGIEQEGGSGGPESAEGTMRRLAGWRVRRLPARRNKQQRADEFSVQVNAGNVYLPARLLLGGRWAGWAKAFVEELMHFPFGTHSDQVDAASGAFQLLTSGRYDVGPLPE